MIKEEPLDYCRVKKISDKGYGFLTSLHYAGNVFFHFNKVKDPVVKEKLEKMKRGDVYFYYTSAQGKKGRRVNKLWLDIKEIDPDLIPNFVDDIISEFIYGETNPFEVAYVIKQLRENKYFGSHNLKKLLASEKIFKTPSILKALLTERDKEEISEYEKLIVQFDSGEINKEEWIEAVLKRISNAG